MDKLNQEELDQLAKQQVTMKEREIRAMKEREKEREGKRERKLHILLQPCSECYYQLKWPAETNQSTYVLMPRWG